MSSLIRTPTLASDDLDDGIGATVEAFESAWLSGDIPDIRFFADAPRLSTASATELIHELIRIDLEYRWKTEAAVAEAGASRLPLRRLIDDYMALFPELGSLDDLSLDLIIEEYRVRQRWGDRPSATDYLERFPNREARLTTALAEVDCELSREIDLPVTASQSAPSPLAATCDLARIPRFDHRDFVLEAHLGSGGIGKVYRAWWKPEKEHVAVKMLRKSWWRQPGADELFFREAAILIGMRHPSIVEVHGIGRTPQGGCFLVMEFIDGGDLANHIGKDLAFTKVIDWAAQAADALAFAHQRGVVHRDIKPNNLLLEQSGKLRVADFGLALAPSIHHETREGLVGTIAYMAPEQLLNSAEAGPAADIFSLGAVLYTLLTGTRPFDAPSVTTGIKRRLNPPPIASLPANLPGELQAIVTRCMANEPGERFVTAEELAAALRRVMSGETMHK